ncbi:MAG: hypothetical protein NVSMB45_09780 [Ginsengibacter sp.]
MRLIKLRKAALISIVLLIGSLSFGQNPMFSDSIFKAGTPGSGRIWGETFGDYYYKAHSDKENRGGVNQYTGVPEGRSAFAFRRIYLGYDYNISKRFTTELLLASEDNFEQEFTPGQSTISGDLISNNKLGLFIKQANLRWKNIWKGTDLVFGEVYTPSYLLLTAKVWSYRSIEKTISDLRKTPSYDVGITLQNHMDSGGNYGYNIMVGNGTGAKPENDKFKWFYGDVYAKFFNKKLVLDLYADYERLNWIPGFHHSRNMIKGFAAYNTKALTIGIESFVNYGKQDVVGIRGLNKDTLNSVATGVSIYIHGEIIKDKLKYILRYDRYNPNQNYNATVYSKYLGLTPTYEPSNNERFIIAGLDYAVLRNVHFFPNVWYNQYINKSVSDKGYDLVYRLTFQYSFGR